MDRGLKNLLIIIGVILFTTLLYTCIRNYNAKEKYEKQIGMIEEALKSWSKEYAAFLPEEGEMITIPLQTLKQSGYIKEDFQNPKTRRKFSNQLLMTITQKNKNLEYQILDQDKYMIEDYDDINFSAPMVVLKGNAHEYAELGRDYDELGFLAITKDGKEADEVKMSIISEGKNVSLVDTKKLTTYQITYRISYAKEDSEITRIVTVRDTEKPEIEMDRLTVKPEEVQDLNLMTGVKISDNSGTDLKVEVIGSLSSIPEKYLLTYRVTDPSGNMREKKRIIRVEE